MQWWRAALAALSLAAAAGIAEVAGGVAADSYAPVKKYDRETVAQLEKGLLALLGLDRRPLLKKRAPVPEAMRALYEQLSRPLPAPFHHNTPLHHHVANTVRSFTHEESDIDKRFKGHHKFRLAFNVTLPDIEMLKAAELVLSRDSVRLQVKDNNKKHRVLVYDIVKPGVRGKTKPEVRLLDKKWVRTSRAGIVHLDVTAAIERWIWRPEQNHGLLIHVVDAEGAVPSEPRPHVRLRRSVSDSHHSWQARQPVLLAYTDDGRGRLQKPQATEAAATAAEPMTKRRTRGTHSRNRKNPRVSCKRHQLYVDFADVGWSDWIVAPTGYDAYYCHGECPFPLADHLNVTNHALVQTLVNSVNPQAVPRACCVPTTLSSMSMLYMEDEKVVLKNYQEMIVEGCGCR